MYSIDLIMFELLLGSLITILAFSVYNRTSRCKGRFCPLVSVKFELDSSVIDCGIVGAAHSRSHEHAGGGNSLTLHAVRHIKTIWG